MPDQNQLVIQALKGADPTMVHQAQEPNPVPNIVDAFKSFASQGLQGVANQQGIQTPEWSQGLGTILSSPEANAALGVLKGLPRTFYRGQVPGDIRRISTGIPDWDKHLFASSNLASAKMYGPSITTLVAKPDAKILYEGTNDFVKVAGRWRKGESLLDYSNRAAKAARDAGYDATWFKRQGDVGTAIHNPNAFEVKE